MLQVTPHMRILVATDRVDGRKGIDSLAQLCREKLAEDPLSGCLFLFLNQSGTTLKGLCYDGQGYWMCQKRLSKGRFPWPKDPRNSQPLEFHQAYLLLAAGNPTLAGAPQWRPIKPLIPQGPGSCK
jgi:transposase